MTENKTKIDHATKPGYKTTEFWFSAIAAIAGLLLVSGLFGPDTLPATIIGGVLTAIANLGYIGSRANIKSSELINSQELN